MVHVDSTSLTWFYWDTEFGWTPYAVDRPELEPILALFVS